MKLLESILLTILKKIIMSQKISISISKPCLEKFDSFSQTTTGGYCKTCQKNVIDFTKMSQKEIFIHFKNSNIKTCGYFNPSQLKTYTDAILPIAKQNRNWIDYLRISSFLMFVTTTSWSQNTSTVPTIEQHQTDSKPETSNTEKSIDKTLFKVKGKIVDERNLPIAGANITLYNSTINTTSDFEGNFVFPTELSEGDRLLISFIGFSNQIVPVSKTEITVRMEERHLMMMGEVATNKTFVSKPSFFQRLKNIF
jgi:CarboxypepD_reg-like domain